MVALTSLPHTASTPSPGMVALTSLPHIASTPSPGMVARTSLPHIASPPPLTWSTQMRLDWLIHKGRRGFVRI